jgi:helicase
MEVTNIRPNYRDRVIRILDLLSFAPEGKVLRSYIVKKLNIPRSSTTDVLKIMENMGMVRVCVIKRKYVKFGAEKYVCIPNKVKQTVELTPEGKEIHENLQKIEPVFKLPYIVEKYLKIKKIEELNELQKRFVNRHLLFSPCNVTIFAYPGTGKTLISEMAMLCEKINNKGRALYVTPYKALDFQKYSEFMNSFGQMGFSVEITDGDNYISHERLRKADIIIATYERVLGAMRSNFSWLRDISLVCFDEITLLADEERGGALDLVITGFKNRSPQPRIITMSSLVGNTKNIEGWLSSQSVIENSPVMEIDECLVFKKGDDIVFWHKDGNIEKKVSKLTDVEYLVRENIKRNERTLVFVGTREGAEIHAKLFKKYHHQSKRLSKEVDEFLKNDVKEMTTLIKDLCELLKYGVAFHHAGLQRKARRFVNRLLEEGKLKTVVATTTLAHGVNYSIDNVIINLQSFMPIQELKGYEYLNIKGRTGRKLSKVANVYIVTKPDDANVLFDFYFFGTPEPITPSNTFREDMIATQILIETEKGKMKRKDLMEKISKTLQAKSMRLDSAVVSRAIRNLVRFGLIRQTNSEFEITELGKKVNKVNLPTYDAIKLLHFRIPDDVSDQELLYIASDIDIAKNIMGKGKISKVLPIKTKIVEGWLTSKSIDEIRKSTAKTFDDEDIIKLMEYTILSLNKISEFLNSKKIKRRARRLAKMLSEKLEKYK